MLYIYGGHDIREGQMNSLWSLDMNAVGSLTESGSSGLEWQLRKTYGTKTPGKTLPVPPAPLPNVARLLTLFRPYLAP